MVEHHNAGRDSSIIIQFTGIPVPVKRSPPNPSEVGLGPGVPQPYPLWVRVWPWGSWSSPIEVIYWAHLTVAIWSTPFYFFFFFLFSKWIHWAQTEVTIDNGLQRSWGSPSFLATFSDCPIPLALSLSLRSFSPWGQRDLIQILVLVSYYLCDHGNCLNVSEPLLSSFAKTGVCWKGDDWCLLNIQQVLGQLRVYRGDDFCLGLGPI